MLTEREYGVQPTMHANNRGHANCQRAVDVWARAATRIMTYGEPLIGQPEDDLGSDYNSRNADRLNIALEGRRQDEMGARRCTTVPA